MFLLLSQRYIKDRFKRCLIAFVLVVSTPLGAALELAPAFGDNMVLQCDKPVLIWGTAAAGEEVSVTFGSLSPATVADASGRWKVELPAMPPTGEPREMVVRGSKVITLRNVVVGEVWVCSGQSNMYWPVSKADNAEKEIAAAEYPHIRLIKEPKGKWTVCSPQAVGDFSAVAYYFARDLSRELEVPVGLISMSFGGTSATRWMPRAALEKEPELWSFYLERLKPEFEQEKAQYEEKIRAGQPGRQPDWEAFVGWRMGGWYAGTIEKMAPFAMRGVIWYQGENDVSTSRMYGRLFIALIRSWRAAWNEDFPFLFVQLANFDDSKKGGVGRMGESWARQREAQQQALSLPQTGMVVTVDIGEAGNIHPLNKQEVGRRLSRLALRDVFDRSVIADGPIFRACVIEGAKVRIKFEPATSGLELRGSSGFALAGSDGKFMPAEVLLDGEDLLVWSDSVPQPLNVRYAWTNAPEVSLFNKAGWPARPFRSDTEP